MQKVKSITIVDIWLYSLNSIFMKKISESMQSSNSNTFFHQVSSSSFFWGVQINNLFACRPDTKYMHAIYTNYIKTKILSQKSIIQCILQKIVMINQDNHLSSYFALFIFYNIWIFIGSLGWRIAEFSCFLSYLRIGSIISIFS